MKGALRNQKWLIYGIVKKTKKLFKPLFLRVSHFKVLFSKVQIFNVVSQSIKERKKNANTRVMGLTLREFMNGQKIYVNVNIFGKKPS